MKSLKKNKRRESWDSIQGRSTFSIWCCALQLSPLCSVKLKHTSSFFIISSAHIEHIMWFIICSAIVFQMLQFFQKEKDVPSKRESTFQQSLFLSLFYSIFCYIQSVTTVFLNSSVLSVCVCWLFSWKYSLLCSSLSLIQWEKTRQEKRRVWFLAWVVTTAEAAAAAESEPA